MASAKEFRNDRNTVAPVRTDETFYGGPVGGDCLFFGWVFWFVNFQMSEAFMHSMRCFNWIESSFCCFGRWNGSQELFSKRFPFDLKIATFIVWGADWPTDSSSSGNGIAVDLRRQIRFKWLHCFMARVKLSTHSRVSLGPNQVRRFKIFRVIHHAKPIAPRRDYLSICLRVGNRQWMLPTKSPSFETHGKK